MTELPINQKEYLKKYLGIGKAPGEKKKKKKKQTTNRIQIIDDDAEVAFPTTANEEDIMLANEDAPQIVAIIDERPPSLRVDEKTKNPLWQPIGTVDENNQNQQKQTIKGFKIQAKSNDKLSFRDHSPPRRKKRIENEDFSPPRKSKSNNLPVEIVIKEERSVSPNGEGEMTDKSNSPARKNKYIVGDLSPPRKSRETDKSRSQLNFDDDISPPRRNRIVEEDVSPPRRRREMMDKSRSQSRWDDDSSPPRKRNKERDQSLPRKNRELKDDSRSRLNNYNDNSPPRKSRKTGRDFSPARKSKEIADKTRSLSKHNDHSPSRRGKSSETSVRRDHSSSRKHRKEESSKSSIDEKRPKKMEKTVDGKSSRHGLVDASELAQETENLQSQQEKLFNSLSEEASGRNSETVYRDRQTGKIRNIEEEEEKKRKKQEEEQKNKEKYERWGRGLTQVESQAQKLQEQLHEMSKPLARYADDEDLEKYLKEQEREGDPMLAYIRKKKRKKAADAGEVAKPKFEGEFMPNRYGIRPGHRWDGVDRSNGYEKKWFEIQNEKKALQEDSYKWSTEDM